MSEGEDKTEQPSEFKLKEARKKGQVVKSADVAALTCLFFSVVFLVLFLPFSFRKWAEFLKKIHGLGFYHLPDYLIQKTSQDALDLWFMLSIPVLFVASLGAVIGNVSQFGFLLTSHPIKPDLKKLNPVAGIKKLFSKNRIVEFIKQIFKLGAVMMVIYITIKDQLWNLIMLMRLDLSAALLVSNNLIISIVTKVLLCFFVIAILDFYWQRYAFFKSMRMSKHEVKREYKQQEGDPLIKQERRRFYHETMETMSPSSVQNATVIITNPSHLAVALLFDEDKNTVPIVIAKGVGKYAQIIIKEAKAYDVPIMRNVPLARDLSWLDINEEIPKSLYDSVAEVLTFVHELNASIEGRLNQ